MAVVEYGCEPYPRTRVISTIIAETPFIDCEFLLQPNLVSERQRAALRWPVRF